MGNTNTGIRKRASYPEYKPSGIEWLGEIPAHWNISAIKRLFNIQLGKMLQNNPASEEDVSVPYIKALHVQWDNVITQDLPEMWASPTDIEQFSIQDGDLLVCEGGEAGRAGIVKSPPKPCIIQNALHRVRSNGSDVRLLLYVLQVVKSSGWFDVLCNRATIAHFTREKLSELRIPLPESIPEQHSIASFLDRETARIDGLIEKKRRQIELLQEKRSALISSMVTGRLSIVKDPGSGRIRAATDADVERIRQRDPSSILVDCTSRKDSGVEWLGQIPAHWETKRIKHLGQIRYGLGEPPEYVEEGLPFIRATDIKHGIIDLDAVRKVRPEDIPWSRRPALKFHEILVVRSGAYTGDSAIITESAVGCIAGYDMVLTINRAYPPFVGWALLSKYMLQGQIYLERLRAAQPHINAEELGELFVLIPPLPEQRQIVAVMDMETKLIDTLKMKVEHSIEKLREFRTALISAAVTGKIDVRDEVRYAN